LHPAISIDAVYKVIIKSVPPGSVRIDGKNQGTTPVTLSLCGCQLFFRPRASCTFRATAT